MTGNTARTNQTQVGLVVGIRIVKGTILTRASSVPLGYSSQICIGSRFGTRQTSTFVLEVDVGYECIDAGVVAKEVDRRGEFKAGGVPNWIVGILREDPLGLIGCLSLR